MFEHIDDDDYPKNLEGETGREMRQECNQPKREVVNRHLNNGWEIVSRDPLTLQRGRLKREFRGNLLIDSDD